ncbi:hypothetical protein CDIK_0080 [Cucumispora dikerogammari]|nr:hypothetical protein CDIK_0080 [Cucumispora dikerogammari]
MLILINSCLWKYYTTASLVVEYLNTRKCFVLCFQESPSIINRIPERKIFERKKKEHIQPWNIYSNNSGIRDALISNFDRSLFISPNLINQSCDDAENRNKCSSTIFTSVCTDISSSNSHIEASIDNGFDFTNVWNSDIAGYTLSEIFDFIEIGINPAEQQVSMDIDAKERESIQTQNKSTQYNEQQTSDLPDGFCKQACSSILSEEGHPNNKIFIPECATVDNIETGGYEPYHIHQYNPSNASATELFNGSNKEIEICDDIKRSRDVSMLENSKNDYELKFVGNGDLCVDFISTGVINSKYNSHNIKSVENNRFDIRNNPSIESTEFQNLLYKPFDVKPTQCENNLYNIQENESHHNLKNPLIYTPRLNKVVEPLSQSQHSEYITGFIPIFIEKNILLSHQISENIKSLVTKVYYIREQNSSSSCDIKRHKQAPTHTLSIDEISTSISNDRLLIHFRISSVPVFLCPVVFKLPDDCVLLLPKYKQGHSSFFQNINVTISAPIKLKAVIKDFLPKFVFVSNINFFDSTYYCQKIRQWRVFSEEVAVRCSYNKRSSDRPCISKLKNSEYAKSHRLSYILYWLDTHNGNKIIKQFPISSCISQIATKLYILKNHLKIMSEIPFSVYGLKRGIIEICKFEKEFLKDEKVLRSCIGKNISECDLISAYNKVRISIRVFFSSILSSTEYIEYR